MADKTSLYREVKRLISIRQEHEALQSGGEAEFDGEQVTVPPCPAGFYTLA